MKRFWLLGAVLGLGMFFWGTNDLRAAEAGTDQAKLRAEARKLQGDGNYNDAYLVFRKLALDPNDDPRLVGEDLQMATRCLQRLNRLNEVDEFREAVIEVHKNNWRLLWAAARNYMELPHQGFMIAGEFWRGPHRGGGKVVHAVERDRVRALQLMVQALPLARQDDDHAAVGEFLLYLAQVLLNNRGYQESWRLQYLTDLSKLPDYEEGWPYYRQTPGAPVDEEGNPVFHHVPKSFEDAKTDGERWRWCLEQAMEFNPQKKNAVRKQYADFLFNQFGVQTMAFYGWRFGRMQTDDTKEESGTYELHTLGEDETIARLATGVKRFKLPDEFNFIKVYQKIVEEPQTGYAEQALVQLANIFENRRQYPKAADYWRKVIELNPRDHYKRRLRQIEGNWGRFEPIMTQPAGKGATVEFRFRNGHVIELVAHEIKIQQLLDDVKAYIKSNPSQVDWRKVNIGNIGYRLIHQNQKQYVGAEVASPHPCSVPAPICSRPRCATAIPAISSSGSTTRHWSKSRWTARRITSWPMQ